MRDAVQEGMASLSESGLSVVRDIYYMKLMAVEVVCQLALDTMAVTPSDSGLFQKLAEQLQEESEHLNLCRMHLARRDAFAARPAYVGDFARMMRLYGGRRRRTLPLAVAVVLCVVVESVALGQLASARIPDPELCALLHKLGEDEEEHYHLVTRIVAPAAASRASLLERAATHMILLRIANITLRKWWPGQALSYRTLGLDLNSFLEDVMQRSSQALRPLGLFFPKELLLRLARKAIPVADSPN
jgi:hypothetical protein